MNKNIGDIDKIVRIILGTVFLLVGVFSKVNTGLSILIFSLAGIAYATAFANF